ncbi:glycogen synthase kinase-3 beta-like [Tropilaelaps mercedesae]|uniref:Glycogen synthase kinase-3 beta-like n=1 Tax=Tropilaelaps mercedesae TaxID=418985 RepID=A0A1V9XBQ9_9ACAR|nr:glycogen synthase kinase-3 beta-like [Tropilaelaps mercedesae]
MRSLDHLNCVRLFYYFVTQLVDGLHLNLVMEFMSDSLASILCRHGRANFDIHPTMIQIYLYQILRGTAYLHSKNIAHRDLKPHNILVDSVTSLLKLCDFGASKQLGDGSMNVAYICSRYYRAPELLLGSTTYGVSIDTWSIGCIFAELFILRPFFIGRNSTEQLVKVIEFLGVPPQGQMQTMNPSFPHIIRKYEPIAMMKKLQNKPSYRAAALLTKMLEFEPNERVDCWDALCHTYFEHLRRPGAQQPDGRPLPPLFNFTKAELQRNPSINSLIMPMPDLRPKGILRPHDQTMRKRILECFEVHEKSPQPLDLSGDNPGPSTLRMDTHQETQVMESGTKDVPKDKESRRSQATLENMSPGKAIRSGKRRKVLDKKSNDAPRYTTSKT